MLVVVVVGTSTMHWTLIAAGVLLSLFALVLVVGALLPWHFHGTVRFMTTGLSQVELFKVGYSVLCLGCGGLVGSWPM